jgi:hypothetical protein
MPVSMVVLCGVLVIKLLNHAYNHKRTSKNSRNNLLLDQNANRS